MLDSLRVFQLVARTGSFTEAARLAALTRPAVSQHVRRLEQHFGTLLLTRTTRRVELTRAGEVLLEHANRVLAAMAELEAAMASVRRPASRTLTIGASTLPGECLVPRALAALRADHPDVDVQVRVSDTDAVLEWVRGGEVDLGLIGRRASEPGLAVEPFAEDEIVLAFPPGSRTPPVVSPSDLRQLPLVLRERGSATRSTVLAALARAGIHPGDLQIVAELGSPEAVKAAVRQGMGAAFLSALCLRPGELPWARVEGLPLLRPLCAVWRRDRPLPGAARALLDHLRPSGASADRAAQRTSAGQGPQRTSAGEAPQEGGEGVGPEHQQHVADQK